MKAIYYYLYRDIVGKNRLQPEYGPELHKERGPSYTLYGCK